jgi:hypothetical protein
VDSKYPRDGVAVGAGDFKLKLTAGSARLVLGSVVDLGWLEIAKGAGFEGTTVSQLSA